ncbi:MAG: NAD-dependent epimerase/dehydratase family protein [Bacteroidota bacterium]
MTVSQKNTSSVLVIGASGQIGQDLTTALSRELGPEHVIAADIREGSTHSGPSVQLDVCDRKSLYQIIDQYQVDTIYHLAAILSAKGEQDPQLAWQLNMDGLLNVLEAGRETRINRIFWPSSIAVFGPNSPRDKTPQHSIMDPNTVYGISKLAGERWCEYYHQKYGVDVRSVRFPGLISYESPPGGGTTDYAVEIFYSALREGKYTCFLQAGTYLPMLYMPDAIAGILSLMKAPSDQIRVRSSYNMGGLSFEPGELAQAIRQHLPDFNIQYVPDFRQSIADSWPSSIDDQEAKTDWGWSPTYDLERMVQDMLHQLQARHTSQQLV